LQTAVTCVYFEITYCVQFANNLGGLEVRVTGLYFWKWHVDFCHSFCSGWENFLQFYFSFAVVKII